MFKRFKNVFGIKKSSIIISAAVLFFGASVYAATQMDTVTPSVLEQVSDGTAPKVASVYTQSTINDAEKARQWALDDANFDVVWKNFKTELDTSTTDIFVVDLGDELVDLTHSDLAGAKYVLSADSTNGDVIGYDFGTIDVNGQATTTKNWRTLYTAGGSEYVTYYHGTHLAGIVGARHNSIGIAGCDAKVYVIPVTQGINENAIMWIADTLYPMIQTKTGKTPHIIVQCARSHSVSSAYVPNLAAVKHMTDKGILFINAAGNDALDMGKGYGSNKEHYDDGVISYDYTYVGPYYPTACALSADNCITVANHDMDRNLATSSNYSTSGDSAIVNISAPGSRIVSTGRGTTSEGTQKDEYFVETGTSMAAPYVAGAAAILWRMFPDATAAQVKQMILAGANVSHNQTTAARFGKTATTIGGYVQTGFLDVAASVNTSKAILGDTMGKTVVIPVKTITLSADKLSVAGGKTVTINASDIKPFTASNKAITFHTDADSSVATITASDTTCTLTTRNVESTTNVNVWATADDGLGGQSNNLTVAVTPSEIKLTGLKIYQNGQELTNGQTINMGAGDGNKVSLTVEPIPANATVKTSDYTWTVSNKSSSYNLNVMPTANGKSLDIVTLGDGTFTVTASAKTTSSNASANVNVSATDAITLRNISIATDKTSFKVGDKAVLSLTANPSTAVWEPSNTVWTIESGSENVALSVNGGSTVEVTAINSGTATIKAVNGSASDTITLTATKDGVQTINVTSVSLNKTSLILKLNADGNNINSNEYSDTLVATVNPSNATVQGVSWASSNPTVASVSDTGVVTALSEGSAVITATSLGETDDGSKVSATCTVTVTKVASDNGNTGGNTGGSSDSGSGGGGGCNAGYGIIALLSIVPLALRKKNK